MGQERELTEVQTASGSWDGVPGSGKEREADVPTRARSRRQRTGRRTLGVLLAPLVALGATLALASSPALALSQRGHTFAFSFGVPGVAEQQMLHPSGIAVNDTTGDVYVADRGNGRIDIYKPKLNGKSELVGETYVESIKVPFPESVAVDNSANAADPSKEDLYVVTTTAVEGKEKHLEPEPEEEDARIHKFGPKGEHMGTLKGYKGPAKGSSLEEFTPVKGVAVDNSGHLFVYDEEAIYRFSDAKANKGEAEVHSGLNEEPTNGLAVDAEGNFYVGTYAEETEANETLVGLVEKEDGLGELPVVAKLKSNGEVAIHELETEWSPAVAVNTREELANQVNELNDVYIDNVSGDGVGQTSTVAAFNKEGKLIQRFGTTPAMKFADALAVDSTTGAVYVADADTDSIDVFELEPPGPPQVSDLSSSTGSSGLTTLTGQVSSGGGKTKYYFEIGQGDCRSVPSPCKKTIETPATLDGFAEAAVSEELAEALGTGIYHYRLVAESEYGTAYTPERTITVADPRGDLPDAREWELVSPVCKNGAEPEAMTEEGGEIEAAEDGHAITYVADGPMPCEAKPEGNRSPEYTQILSTRSATGWSSQDLETPESKAGGIQVGFPPEYQAFSPSLAVALVEPYAENPGSGSFAAPPLSPPAPGGEGRADVEQELASEGKAYQEKTFYLRDDPPLQPQAEVGKPSEEEATEAKEYAKAHANGEEMQFPGFLPLVTKADSPGGELTPFGGSRSSGVTVQGATPDLSHVVFSSYKATSGLYETGWFKKETGPDENLREEVRLVSKLPGEAGATVPALSAYLGGGFVGEGTIGVDVRHAISENGRLVVWQEKLGGEGGHLLVTDTETRESTQLDAVQSGASGAGGPEPSFQTASADGTRIFFTDAQRITPDSHGHSGEPSEHDLYVAELVSAKPLRYQITDLTPKGIHGEEGADVQVHLNKAGGVLGASEDGSYVYFVADGALTASASRGSCQTGDEEEPVGTCNLYVRHYEDGEWSPTKLVAVLSGEDRPDWNGSGYAGDLANETARVSPSGEYLAFMSERPLTGYDNEDAVSGHRDEEVFLYDAANEGLVCVSCRPTGVQPHGVEDLGGENVGLPGEEGKGLLVDRLQVWAANYGATVDDWLAGNIPGWTSSSLETANYQSRYLLDDGRLFFNSPDELVPAVEGEGVKERVYEYEPDGVGGCEDEAGCIGLISSASATHESAFLDASASGSDVFFLSAEQLVPADTEADTFNVYDAHVCEPSSPCLLTPTVGPPPCNEVTTPCKEPSPGSAEAFTTPGSVVPTGAGNLAVLGTKVTKPPPVRPKPKSLTRQQQLEKALKACRAKYKANSKKSKRVACEKAAQKKYGPPAKKSSHKAKKSAAKSKEKGK